MIKGEALRRLQDEDQKDADGLNATDSLTDTSTTQQQAEPTDTTQADSLPEPDQKPITENDIQAEKRKRMEGDLHKFVDLISTHPQLRQKIDTYKSKMEKIGRAYTDVDVISRMGRTDLYDLVHDTGMSFEEIVAGLDIPESEKTHFPADFDNTIEGQLVAQLETSGSKVRHVPYQELADIGLSTQVGFSWFEGHGKPTAPYKQIRYYINARPEKLGDLTAQLARLSDAYGDYGVNFRFKFRNQLANYNKRDTCVAYVYLPDDDNVEKNIQVINQAMKGIPAGLIRQDTSPFLEEITQGIAIANDSRDADSKAKGSYTAQITASLAESFAEMSGAVTRLDQLNNDQKNIIVAKTMDKLEKQGYF